MTSLGHNELINILASVESAAPDRSIIEKGFIWIFFSSAVKRLMKEAQELHEATEIYYAQPLEVGIMHYGNQSRGF